MTAPEAVITEAAPEVSYYVLMHRPVGDPSRSDNGIPYVANLRDAVRSYIVSGEMPTDVEAMVAYSETLSETSTSIAVGLGRKAAMASPDYPVDRDMQARLGEVMEMLLAPETPEDESEVSVGLPVTSTAWLEEGNCHGLDTEVMLPGRRKGEFSKAVKVCVGCSAVTACLIDALAKPAAEVHGVRAGTSHKLRGKMRRDMKAQSLTPAEYVAALVKVAEAA